MQLEFDPCKDALNISKPNGLSLADSMLVYEHPSKITWLGKQFDDSEERLMDIAMVDVLGIVLVLVYVIRGERVRAISLRRASNTERRQYEQAKQD